MSSARLAQAADCPWSSAQAAQQYAPEQLADQVIAQMTLSEKLGIVDLGSANGYENIDTGVPSLCIPALTLQDGPAGLASGDTGVTQLPAPIALAATFEPLLATDYGQVLGSEAEGQGIDVVQAPDLNLVRVPESGRSFETLGEDPLLASVLGTDEVQGIQAEGTLSEIKHYTAYTQETDRLSLDQDASTRALEEVYDEPFQAAVTEGGAAAVMCAFGAINETPTCQDQAILSGLKGLRGFGGFVRSDLGAVSDPVAAFQAGLDMIKPSAEAALAAAVADGQLPMSRLDDAVQRVLSEEFAFGLIDNPRTGAIGDDVITPADTAVALQVAEQSIVLLKDDSAVLPLAAGSSGPSVAVIGTDASTGAATTGGGSAQVNAPFTVTPLQALESELGPARVAYDPATPSALPTVLFGSSSSAPPASTCGAAEPPTPATTPPPGSSTTSSATSIATTTTLAGSGNTTSTTAPVTTTQASTTSSTTSPTSSTTSSTSSTTSSTTSIPTTTTLAGSGSTTSTTAPVTTTQASTTSSTLPATSIATTTALGASGSTTSTTAPVTTTQVSTTSSTLSTTSTTMPASTVTPQDDTATGPLSGPGWNTTITSFTAPTPGTYALWLTSDGDAFLFVNGASVLSASGLQNELTTSTTLQLRAGTTVSFDLSWFSHVEDQPVVSIDDVSDAIASAVSAAQQASVPIVFACDAESEGSDRQNLDLPGYQNALISAVAVANPRTVVVLNTGGAVLTPWLGQVAAVLEAWYPGEEDGNAIAAVLDGQVDPTGRLPVTFPVTQAAQPFSSTSSRPGNSGVVSFASGLDIGYRGYLATGTEMCFPFGYGLSYTSFSISDLRLAPVSGGYDATVDVANVGASAGRDVLEAYLSFPSGSGEPPEQLAGFSSVDLAPGTAATANMVLPPRGFEADLSGSLAPLPGDYVLSIGTSATNLLLDTVLVAPSAAGTTRPAVSGTQTGASSGGSDSGAGSSSPAGPQPAAPASSNPAPADLLLGSALWVTAPDGRVAGLGEAQELRPVRIAKSGGPVAAIAGTPDGDGYWVASSSGEVRAAGDAHVYAARSYGRIARPVVAMATTPVGKGYWLATADGHVYAYGDARLEARRGGTRAGKLVAIVATPDGRGYWLASASGKVVAYGNARVERVPPQVILHSPVVAMAATPGGKGYWLAAADGHVEAFGDARVERVPPQVIVHSPVVAMAATPDGKGYWLATADGHVEAFGDASRYAATPRTRVLGQVVAMAAS